MKEALQFRLIIEQDQGVIIRRSFHRSHNYGLHWDY